MSLSFRCCKFSSKLIMQSSCYCELREMVECCKFSSKLMQSSCYCKLREMVECCSLCKFK